MKLPLWIPILWFIAWIGVYLWQQKISALGWGHQVVAVVGIAGGILLFWLALRGEDDEEEE